MKVKKGVSGMGDGIKDFKTCLESEITTRRRTGHFPDWSRVPCLRHSDHRSGYPETGCQQACDANWKPASEDKGVESNTVKLEMPRQGVDGHVER